MLRRLTLPLLLSLFVVLAGCDSSSSGDGTAATSLTGTWTGQVNSQGLTFTFEIQLLDTGSAVTGTGSLLSAQEAVAYNVEGTYRHPSISLRLLYLNIPGRPPTDLVGMVTEDRTRIQAQVAGAGFGGESIELTRR